MKAKSMLTKVSLLNSNLDFEHEKGGKIERMFTALMIYTLLFPITNIRSSAHVFFFGGLEPTGVATILMLMKKGKEKKKQQRLQRESNNDNSELQNDENYKVQ